MLKKILHYFSWLINPFSKPPGYEVIIGAIEIDIDAIEQVKKVLSENRFMFVNDIDSPLYREIIISEFKRMRKYLIDVSFSHTKIQYPERRSKLSIAITNYWNGNEPELKAEIDGIGRSLQTELSRFVGKERVTIHSHRTELPMA